MLFALGLTVLVVGALDVGLLFFPPQWASLDWEFGTIAGVMQGLPLATVGLGLMAAGATARAWTRTQWILSVVALLVSVLCVVLVVMFMLDVPLALRAVQPVLKPGVKKTAIKTISMGMTYFGWYALLGIWTWRRAKATKGAAT